MSGPGAAGGANRAASLLIDVSAVTTLLAGLAVALAVTLAGWRPVVLLSGSMAPAAPAGSLVVTAPVDAMSLQVGDVVVVQPPGLDQRVTHRIVNLDRQAASVVAQTRGDANPAPDPEPVQLHGQVARQQFAVPRLGQWLLRLGPTGALGLVMSALAVAGLVDLARRRTAAIDQVTHTSTRSSTPQPGRAL